MYQELLETERRLDWTMTRKRIEVQDALSRTPSVRWPSNSILSWFLTFGNINQQTTRTLRIFLSHTVSGQVWQTGGEPSNANFETGEGIPAWQVRIEGRLLEVRFY